MGDSIMPELESDRGSLFLIGSDGLMEKNEISWLGEKVYADSVLDAADDNVAQIHHDLEYPDHFILWVYDPRDKRTHEYHVTVEMEPSFYLKSMP